MLENYGRAAPWPEQDPTRSIVGPLWRGNWWSEVYPTEVHAARGKIG